MSQSDLRHIFHSLLSIIVLRDIHTGHGVNESENLPRTRIKSWPGEGWRVGVEIGSETNESFTKFAYAEHVKEIWAMKLWFKLA